ncbi:hypothetical protein SCD_n00251 [Sulfuricella denitrificans skB26]|uniref:Uncharacterized protein n=1 Tax=Sulfuricella denitrificans (strain DSM 22764 / NBRC 105220 / skB26) TaxID=1163617 RepID=S6A9H1_SULDS|nr:hypothetical protein SCD_n00251 [Sulfuricella denitrificans skB26]
MITREGLSSGLKKEWVDKRHPAAADKEMECPAHFHLMGKWPGIEDVGMNELPTQQAQKPTTNQSDIYSAGNADFSRISFGDIHEYGTDYAAKKCPSDYFHYSP